VTRMNESSGRLDRTYTRCHLRPGGLPGVSTLPIRVCTGWCIGSP